jgi:hypothetical protein
MESESEIVGTLVEQEVLLVVVLYYYYYYFFLSPIFGRHKR